MAQSKEALTQAILDDIRLELVRQNTKFGYPQKHSLPSWGCILGGEVGETHKAIIEDEDTLALRRELTQVAAVCVNMIIHLEEYNIGT